MDYKKMAIDDLKRHENRIQSIEAITEKIKALEYEKLSLRGMSNSEPVQGGDLNRQETKLINIISEQGRLRNQLVAVQTHVERLDKALDNLSDKERTVLDRFYINPLRDHVELLCEELGYEKRQVYRIKDNALYNLTIALYGIEDL